MSLLTIPHDPLAMIAWGINILFQVAIPFAVGVLAAIGAIQAITTRPDAFDAADRKPRNIWAGMLAGSAVFLLVPGLGWVFLGIPVIAGLVITGVWWLDVRPHLRDILANAQG